jgi:hypothetical protein
MKIEDQSKKFKTLIIPKDLRQRVHFKAAQDLMIKNEGALRYSDEEYEKRFKDLAKANMLNHNYTTFYN